MESSLLRVSALKIATDLELSAYYRQKVQFQERLDDNEWRLDFSRGAVQSLTEAEEFLKDGGLLEALMRLQTRRVDVHRELNETFKKKVLLEQEHDKLRLQIAYLKGCLDTKEDEQVKMQLSSAYNTRATIERQRKATESAVHFLRGMTASEDEVEKFIQSEMKPTLVSSSVETSPGVVGPNFNGQAMPKPDRVNFPDDEISTITYPEFDPGTYQPITLQGMVDSESAKVEK